MRLDQFDLSTPDPTANGNGASQNCRNLIDKYISIQGGTYVFSIQIVWTMDNGDTWQELIAATASAVAATAFPQSATHVRAVVSSFTSETTPPVIRLVGRNTEVSP